jgi:hypothetical protein
MVLPVIARAVASKLAKDAAKNTAKQTAKEAAETSAQQAAKETAKFPGQRLTGTRAAKDTKEPTEYTPELSGRMRYRQPREDEFFETRTPRMSDDYKQGGRVKGYAKGGSASSRADGCATKGKTKGRFV